MSGMQWEKARRRELGRDGIVIKRHTVNRPNRHKAKRKRPRQRPQSKPQPPIAVCRTCQGRGRLANPYRTCPTCDGTQV